MVPIVLYCAAAAANYMPNHGSAGMETVEEDVSELVIVCYSAPIFGGSIQVDTGSATPLIHLARRVRIS